QRSAANRVLDTPLPSYLTLEPVQELRKKCPSVFNTFGVISGLFSLKLACARYNGTIEGAARHQETGKGKDISPFRGRSPLFLQVDPAKREMSFLRPAGVIAEAAAVLPAARERHPSAAVDA